MIEKISLHTLTIVYILILSIISFIFMGIDKKRALNNKWRIKESTLLLLSFIGGAIGTFIGMKVFNHKIRNKKFYLAVPILCIIIILMLIIILTN